METKANTTLIGIFTLAVLTVFVLFLWWFLRGGEGTSRTEYRVVFDGPVAGLRKGANVFFNGIRKGEVRSINVDPNDPSRVVAVIAVASDTPIRTNTVTTLEVQILSGIASLSLVAGKEPAEPLRTQPGQTLPELHAQPSGMQDLMQGARQVMANIDRLVSRLDDTVSSNRASVEQTLRNVERFTQALGDNSEGVASFLKETGEAAKQIAALTRRLDAVTGQVEAMMQGTEPGQIGQIMRNVDRFTQALGGNSQSVDQLLRNAGEVSAKLNGMADRLDGILRGLEGEGTNNMFAEFTAAAKSIRTLAERLDGRTAQLTTSINGFTDRTIRDIQSLSSDGRRTLAELERTLRSLERNPQRFIFGGSGVPEYNRR